MYIYVFVYIHVNAAHFHAYTDLEKNIRYGLHRSWPVYTMSFNLTNEGVNCLPIYTLQWCMRSEEGQAFWKESVKHVIDRLNYLYYICVKNNIYNYSEYNDLQVLNNNK